MKEVSILFLKTHDYRLRMNVTYYHSYDIIIREDENGNPKYIKNRIGNNLTIISLDVFMKYCLWKYNETCGK